MVDGVQSSLPKTTSEKVTFRWKFQCGVSLVGWIDCMEAQKVNNELSNSYPDSKVALPEHVEGWLFGSSAFNYFRCK